MTLVRPWKIKAGDILISTAGDGLLRKVTSVNTVGTNIQVNTEFASLVDAIEQGDLELDQPLYTSQVKSVRISCTRTEIQK